MVSNEKYKKEDLERLIFDEKLSYEEIGRRYEVSGAYIKKVSRKLGIDLPVRKKFPKGFKPHNAGTAMQIECANCSEIINDPSWSEQKYCDDKCFREHKKKKKYDHYFNNQEEYCKIRTMDFFKPYLYEAQDYKCEICGLDNEWNSKPLNFILDHIDGDASNNRRENLRLVCHNCDSQLDTYKSKNKNSARKDRYLRSYKN